MTLQTWEIRFKYRPIWEIKAVFTILLSYAIFIKFPAKIDFPVKDKPEYKCFPI